MTTIKHWSGDDALTLRDLVRFAEGMGWDMDLPLAQFQQQDNGAMEMWLVRGVKATDSGMAEHGFADDHGYIDLDFWHEDDWWDRHSDESLAVNAESE